MNEAGARGGGACCLDDVLITPQLALRPSRTPDYAAENRALTSLAQEMAKNPGAVLQKCAERAMELCRADSAGISILEPGGTNGIFRWAAAVGAFAANANGTMPREASPCGIVIARDSVLLFNEAERFFPALRDVEPRIYENLLAPWHVNGEAQGTLWVIKHTPEGRFDAEDARVLASLARFAAIAHRTVCAFNQARQGREELQESEARFRHMADSAPALIWMTDKDGQVTFANMHYDHMFGRPAADMLGEGWTKIVLLDDLERHSAAFAAAFRARALFKTETRVRDRHGQVRWLRCEGVPRLDDAGTFLGYTGCNVDITEARLAAEELERRVAARTAELMTAEETLRQAQKMEAVGQLTGGIAHDFNNMLQGIGGSLEMARRRIEKGQPGEALRYLDSAWEAMGRAAGLTRRLLAFARRQQLDPKLVDPNELVGGLAELIRRTVGPEIRLELQLSRSAGSVLCDPNELENALLNLCINARDAMPIGGRLVIGTEAMHLSAAEVAVQEGLVAGDYTTISVADTGTGMPAEVLERAFEPFFTTKPQGQGTGLGLSQVYGFVRQSGGVVWLESVPGQGTAVRILLPRREGAEASPEPEDLVVPEPTAEDAIVLLVDDEDSVRGPAAERLRELGYRLLEATDGSAALRLLDGGTGIDLLVTDVGLPGGMNGRQVAEAIRERMPDVPVLFITGYAGTKLPTGAEVIGKPFGLEGLAQRIQALLAGRTDEAARPPGSGSASADVLGDPEQPT